VIELQAGEAGRRLHAAARDGGGGAGRAARAAIAQPDDVSMVLHTSGTTSRPKIVPLSQRNLCASARNIRARCSSRPPTAA
jgi:oxalate---CoA ligase